MIPRYSRDIVTNIWSQESKYKIWLDIEIYAAEAMEKYKIIPKGVAAKVRKKSKINVLKYFFSFLEYCKVEDLDGGEVKFIREGFEKRVSSIPLYDSWDLDVFLKSGVKGTLQEIHRFDC